MKISRRLLLAGGAAAVAAPSIASALDKSASKRPNIVWIVVHDVHAPLLGCYGNPLAKTPALDAMARDGIRFTNAFTTTPVCAPSRFALMTGAYPSACAPAHQQRAAAKVPDALQPLPLHMRASGYYCTNNVFTDYNMAADEDAMWDECSITAHWRNRPTGKPFFCVYNYLITHEMNAFGRAKPITDPAAVKLPAFLPNTPEIREVLARNVDMINRQDVAVAHLLDELRADGLADETFVFFLADHGGIHPRSKRYCYDDGLHVPLIVQVPAAWKALVHSPVGAPNNELISHVDMAPTTLALAGVPVPKTMMGRAFLGARVSPKRSYAFSMRDRMDERYDLVQSARDERYRYIRNYNPQRLYGEHETYEWQSVAYQSWESAYLAGTLNAAQEAFWHPKPVEELYDMTVDPESVHNLAGDPAHGAQLLKMRRSLDDHLLTINDNGFIPEGAPGEGYDESRRAGAYPLKSLIELSSLVLARDPKHLPQFIAGLSHENEVMRYWHAHGLILAGAPSPAIGAQIAQRLAVEKSDSVRCALAEAVLVAGNPDLSLQTLVEILGRENAHDKARLRTLNVMLAFAPDQLKPARQAVVTAVDGKNEYLRRNAKYLLLRIDAAYKPTTKIETGPDGIFKMGKIIGDPRI